MPNTQQALETIVKGTPPPPQAVAIPLATTTAPGLMSPEDKAALTAPVAASRLPAATATVAGAVTTSQINSVAASTVATAMKDTVNTTELFQTVFIDTYNGENRNPQNGISTIFVAPYDMRISWLTVSFERMNWGTDTTNFLSFTARNFTTAGGKIIVTKSTTDEAIAARKPWRFDAVAWNETNRVLKAGETFNFGWNKTGTLDFYLPLTVIVGYEPL